MQDIKLSEATGDYARMGFETVQDSDGKTLLNGTLSATARWIDADGTSTAAAGTFSQPDSTNAGGLRYYTPTAGELASKGAAWLRISGTVGGVAFRTRSIQINVTGTDKYDAVRAGMTALPNAVAGAGNGLPVLHASTALGTVYIDATGQVTVDVWRWNDAGVATPTTAGVPRVDVKAMEANTLTASALATDAVTEIQTGLATVANQTTIINATDSLEASMVTVNTKLDVLAGLMHQNGRVDNTTYAASGFMTSARLRVFASAAACNAATDGAADGADGETMRFTITSVEEGTARVLSYRLTRVL